MKFQILFLSILTATHARYEPKGPRLRGGDDRDLELVLVSHWDDWENKQKQTTLSKGDSATVQCDFGECCLKKGDFEDESSVLHFPHYAIGVMGCERSIRYSGSLGECTSEQGCVISCHGYSSYLPDEFCEVKVQAGSVGGNDGKDSSSRQSFQPPTPPQPQPSPSRSRPIPIPPNRGGNTSAMKTTRVVEGDSATFQCRSGSQSCQVVKGRFHVNSQERNDYYSKGLLDHCNEKQCVISCDEGCKLDVQAGSVGGNVEDGDSGGNTSASGTEKTFHVPEGKSVTFQCDSGSQCCWEGQMREMHIMNNFNMGGKCSPSGSSMTGGAKITCGEKQCLISCDEDCKVNVQAGSVGGNVRARPSPPRRPHTPSHTPGISTKGGKETTVPKGGSVTFKCGSGGQCCVDGSWGNVGGNHGKSGGCKDGKDGWASMTGASLSKCEDKKCLISCDGDCEVNVSADYYMNEE